MGVLQKNHFSYGFWGWATKFDSVIYMFCELVEYPLDEYKQEAIKLDLINTNDEKGNWSEYVLTGKKYKIDFKFAYDE